MPAVRRNTMHQAANAHRPTGAPARASLRGRGDLAVAALAVAALGAGGLLHALGKETVGDVLWAGSVALMLVPLGWSVARTLARRDVGVDLIALVAMAAALSLGEFLAGAVVAVMLSGGNALEAFAAGRARRELTALIERAPPGWPSFAPMAVSARCPSTKCA